MLDDATLFRIVHEIAKHGTCSRLNVGALLVHDNRIVSTGYNGVATGLPHCNHFDTNPCHKSVHAEANAIVFAARNGISSDGSTLYCTHGPCDSCAGLIVNAGVKEVKYYKDYRNDNGIRSLRDANVSVVKYEEEIPQTELPEWFEQYEKSTSPLVRRMLWETKLTEQEQLQRCKSCFLNKSECNH